MSKNNQLITLTNAFALVGCVHRDHLRRVMDRIGFDYIVGPGHGRGNSCFIFEHQLPALEEALRKAGLPFKRSPEEKDTKADEAYPNSIHGRLARIEAKLDRLLELWEK